MAELVTKWTNACCLPPAEPVQLGADQVKWLQQIGCGEAVASVEARLTRSVHARQPRKHCDKKP